MRRVTLVVRSGSKLVTPAPFGAFHANISIEGNRAVVAVHGEVDMATAPSLGGLLESLLDHGHTSIVLDLGGVGFFDASGVGVLARLRLLLLPRGGRLALRSVPAAAQRVLDLTGFSGMVDVAPAETPRVDDVRVAATDDLIVQGGMQRRFGAIPTSNDTIDAALRLVVTLASATVGGADGVSVSLHRHGRLMTAAASDDTVLAMDHDQYATGEGPCVSAAAEGRWFHVAALAGEKRWPAFVPRAISEGIACILSSPLMTDGRPIGALNIYSRGENAFGPAEQELAALFASHAAGILVDAAADLPDSEANDRIHAALLSRSVIAQAQGMLMERRRISAAEAGAVIGRASRSAGQTVLEHAVELTRSRPDDGATRGMTPSTATAPSGDAGAPHE